MPTVQYIFDVDQFLRKEWLFVMTSPFITLEAVMNRKQDIAVADDWGRVPAPRGTIKSD